MVESGTPPAPRVADHRFAVDLPGGVLTAHHVVGMDRLDRLEHLDLLVANRLRVERQRRVHRDQRQHLEEVVLHDVADRADLLVELAPLLDAERLGDGDLNSRDRVAAPDPLEEGVAEAEHQEVLHGLLAEVVIDPEDALLGHDVVKRPVELRRRFHVVAERLLDDDRRAFRQPRILDALDERLERRGRHRKVRDAAFPLRRRREARLRSPSAGNGTKCSRSANDLNAAFCSGVREYCLTADSARLQKRWSSQSNGAVPMMSHPRRQQLLKVQVVQRRDQLALCEIAGGADDDDVLVGGRFERH